MNSKKKKECDNCCLSSKQTLILKCVNICNYGSTWPYTIKYDFDKLANDWKNFYANHVPYKNPYFKKYIKFHYFISNFIKQ